MHPLFHEREQDGVDVDLVGNDAEALLEHGGFFGGVGRLVVVVGVFLEAVVRVETAAMELVEEGEPLEGAVVVVAGVFGELEDAELEGVGEVGGAGKEPLTVLVERGEDGCL